MRLRHKLDVRREDGRWSHQFELNSQNGFRNTARYCWASTAGSRFVRLERSSATFARRPR